MSYVVVSVSIAVNSVGVDEERELQSFDSVRNVRIYDDRLLYKHCFFDVSY